MKPSKANSKFCSSTTGICAVKMWAPRDLDGPNPMALPFAVLSPELAPLLLTAFLRHLHPGSAFQIRFQLHSVTHCPVMSCLQWSWPSHSLSGFPCLPLQTGWKPPWPFNSCIMQACSLDSNWAPWTTVVMISACLGAEYDETNSGKLCSSRT
jgi:hypothetical protein